MTLPDLLETALSRGECVLEKPPQRRVILLDGKNVIVEGLDSTRHFSRAEAEAAFRAAIQSALAEGFTAARRDPPKPVAFVQPTRAPEPVLPPPRRPTPPPRPVRAPDLNWLVVPPALQVSIDPFEGAQWAPLFDRRPDGVSFIDIEGEFPEDALALVGERGLPPWATGLGLMSFSVVEDYHAAVLDPTPVWHLLGSLQSLELRSGQAITIPPALPRLSELSIVTSEATIAIVEQLCAAPWPELTSLELFLDASTPLAGHDVLDRLRLDRFPRLRHLALRGLEGSEQVVEALRAAGLSSLVVSHGDTDPLGFGTSPFLEPDGIEVLRPPRFYPLRSARFEGR